MTNVAPAGSAPENEAGAPPTRYVKKSLQSAALLYSLPMLAAFCAVLFYTQFWLSHDVSWYLIATRKFIEGQRLYIDIIEINPPLNFYLTIPALHLSDWTGVSETVGYVVYTSAIGALSGLWLMRLTLRAAIDQAQKAILIGGGLVGLFLLPIGEFAQREHLLLLFALPYLYCALLGDDKLQLSATERILLGLTATFGLALKPYFLLIPAAIVLVGSFKKLFRRIFALENLGLAIGLISYAGFVVIIHPEYFSDVLGVAPKVYGVYGEPAKAVLLRSELIALLMLMVLYFLKGAPRDRISGRLTAASFGALLAYLIQFKGWDYQAIPLAHFVSLTAIWVAHAKGIFSRREIPAAILSLAIVATTLGVHVLPGPYKPATTERFSQYVDRPDRRMVVYSTNVWASFPFVNAVKGDWSSRFPAQWIVPGAYQALKSTDCDALPARCLEYEEILFDVRKANVEDFLRYRPELVFVDVREQKSYFGGVPFDYIQFLREEPSFGEAWSKCKKIGSVGAPGYEVWQCGDTKGKEQTL